MWSISVASITPAELVLATEGAAVRVTVSVGIAKLREEDALDERGQILHVEIVRPEPAIRHALVVEPGDESLGHAVDAGGAVYLATHIQQLAATNPNTVLVSGGDLIGASPLISAIFSSGTYPVNCTRELPWKRSATDST